MNLVLEILGMSATSTVKLQLALRASASVASHVTVVVPTGNCAPESGVQLTLTGGCPSAAEGMSKLIVGVPPTRASAVMSAGQLIVGGLGTAGVGTGSTSAARP